MIGYNLSMIIIVHVVIAVASLLLTSYAFIRPSERVINCAYALVAGTLGSGTLLVLSLPSHILSVCESGLFYLAVVSLGIVAARRRLATVKVVQKSK